MELNDQSHFPYGAHKGKPMEDVPASYLIWLAGQLNQKSERQLSKADKAILEYCKENADVLEHQISQSNNQ